MLSRKNVAGSLFQTGLRPKEEAAVVSVSKGKSSNKIAWRLALLALFTYHIYIYNISREKERK